MPSIQNKEANTATNTIQKGEQLMAIKWNWNAFRKVMGAIATLVVPGLLVWVITLAYKDVEIGGWDWSPAQLTPVVGLITFFGTLLISNLFSNEGNLRKGEVRHAIAASILSVFYYILAILVFTDADPQLSNETVKDVLDNFITMVAVVITFYFGTRTVEEVSKDWRKKVSSATTTTTTTEPPEEK
jgi:hypothetical protein